MSFGFSVFEEDGGFPEMSLCRIELTSKLRC